MKRLSLRRRNPARVLLVDDDPEWIEAMTDVLEIAGYQVATAVDGADALQKYSEVHPAVVITDLEMPVMNGRELLEKLHERDYRVPVVVVSSECSRARSSIVGAFRVLEKVEMSDGVLSVVRDATAHRMSHLPLQKLWAAAVLESPPEPRKTSPVRRIFLAVTSPRYLVAAAVVVASSVALVTRLRA